MWEQRWHAGHGGWIGGEELVEWGEGGGGKRDTHKETDEKNYTDMQYSGTVLGPGVCTFTPSSPSPCLPRGVFKVPEPEVPSADCRLDFSCDFKLSAGGPNCQRVRHPSGPGPLCLNF